MDERDYLNGRRQGRRRAARGVGLYWLGAGMGVLIGGISLADEARARGPYHPGESYARARGPCSPEGAAWTAAEPGAAGATSTAPEAGGATSTAPARADGPAAATRPTRSFEGDARRIETVHFGVRSDCAAEVVRAMADMAEETWGAVQAFVLRMKLPSRAAGERLEILLFDRWEDFEAAARGRGLVVSEAAPGLYDERGDVCLIFNYANSRAVREKREEIERLRVKLEKEKQSPPHRGNPRDILEHMITVAVGGLEEYERLVTETVVRHEIAHQVLTRFGVLGEKDSDRRWLKEGLAMCFESGEAVNPYRLADFKGIDWSWVDLRQLVGDPKYIGPGAEWMAARYAAAWALVFDLTRYQPEAMGKYISGGGGKGTVQERIAEFERGFGALDGEFRKAWLMRMRARAGAAVENK